jgi:ankyrin repeat protein
MDPPGYPKNATLLMPFYKGRLNEHIGTSDSGIFVTALKWQQFDIAILIAEQPDFDVDQQSDDGRTPLSFAAATGSLELVKFLCETKGADVSATDQKQVNPLQYAKREGHTDVTAYLQQSSAAVAGA